MTSCIYRGCKVQTSGASRVSCSLFSGPEGDRHHYVLTCPSLCKCRQTLRTPASLWGSLALVTIVYHLILITFQSQSPNTNRGRVKALVFEFERHRYRAVWIFPVMLTHVGTGTDISVLGVMSLRRLSDSHWLFPNFIFAACHHALRSIDLSRISFLSFWSLDTNHHHLNSHNLHWFQLEVLAWNWYS